MLIGLFIGGMVTFLFSAKTMDAVGRAASKIVVEVRRQFKEIPGIMEGKGEPDYESCVDICTKSAQKRTCYNSNNCNSNSSNCRFNSRSKWSSRITCRINSNRICHGNNDGKLRWSLG